MKQQDVIEFFDQAAAGWDAQLRRNEPVIARILDNAGVRSGVRVLDVACGTGVLIPDYLQRGAAQVTAIDISPEMARIAREKFPQENVTVLCGDAEQAHFPAPFDCIVIYNAFPHFPEPERLLAHLAGLLAPGGTLTVAHGFSRKTLDAHHAKTARQVSNGILPVQELAELFSRYVHVTVQISDEEICRITEYIKPLADSIFEQPTEFEMVTALGFEYFARQGCDLVVCEVGMGGEFDATNVILPPEAAVICNIGLDHTEVLGDTLEKIAATKSGIIKPGCDAVIYREQPSVEAVIEDRCKAVGAKLHKADFADIHLLSHDLTGQVFDWERFKRLKLPLLGDHQLHNAAVALTTATVMQQRGWKLTDDDIREGLASVRWPGRFDVRRSDPLFIIDGGHNPQCIQALVKNIQDYLPGRPLTILTGVLADKDYNCMYRNVEPYAKEFITITPGNPRALNAHDLAAYLSQFGKPVTACDQVADGVRLAVEHAGKDGVVLCYGSLYMIGEIEAGLAQL